MPFSTPSRGRSVVLLSTLSSLMLLAEPGSAQSVRVTPRPGFSLAPQEPVANPGDDSTAMTPTRLAAPDSNVARDEAGAAAAEPRPGNPTAPAHRSVPHLDSGMAPPSPPPSPLEPENPSAAAQIPAPAPSGDEPPPGPLHRPSTGHSSSGARNLHPQTPPREVVSPAPDTAPDISAQPPAPSADAFGGSPLYSSQSTGYFRLEEGPGQRWWFITPAGNAFWSQGLNVVRPGFQTIVEYSADDPGAPNRWAQGALATLRDIGMNTIGPDHFDIFYKWLTPLREADPRMPYVLVFAPIRFKNDLRPGVPKAHFMDIFSAEFERRMAAGARKVATEVAKDPYLIGYQFNNELTWGLFGSFSGLWQDHVSLPADAPGKRAFVETMQERYGHDIEKFRALYGSADRLLASGRYLTKHGHSRPVPRKAAKAIRRKLASDRTPPFQTWDDVARFTDAHLLAQAVHVSPQARADIEAFLGLLADRYHAVATKALRKHDPNHLMLGSKFVGGQPIALPESVLVGAAKHVDAICQNVYFRPGTRYASGIMDFLERSARVTGKPQLVSEWGGFHGQDAAACECYIPLDTQTDRAQAYGRGVRLLASQPWIVGAYFYSYADHAELNWGIVDTQLTPYPEITAAIRANSPHLPDLHAGSSPH